MGAKPAEPTAWLQTQQRPLAGCATWVRFLGFSVPRSHTKQEIRRRLHLLTESIKQGLSPLKAL